MATSIAGTSGGGGGGASSSPGHITGGQIAGIVIAVLIGVLAIGGAITVFWIRRRRQSKQTDNVKTVPRLSDDDRRGWTDLPDDSDATEAPDAEVAITKPPPIQHARRGSIRW